MQGEPEPIPQDSPAEKQTLRISAHRLERASGATSRSTEGRLRLTGGRLARSPACERVDTKSHLH